MVDLYYIYLKNYGVDIILGRECGRVDYTLEM